VSKPRLLQFGLANQNIFLVGTAIDVRRAFVRLESFDSDSRSVVCVKLKQRGHGRLLKMNQLFDISSDDEDIIDFVEHLERPRKRRRYQERKNHLDYWDDQEFYNRFRFSKPSVRRILEKIEEAIKSPTNW
jgi:hypothetical protein